MRPSASSVWVLKVVVFGALRFATRSKCARDGRAVSVTLTVQVGAEVGEYGLRLATGAGVLRLTVQVLETNCSSGWGEVEEGDGGGRP